MSSAKWRLVYLDLNVLSYQQGTDDVFRDLVNAILTELRMLRMKLNNVIIYQYFYWVDVHTTLYAKRFIRVNPSYQGQSKQAFI